MRHIALILLFVAMAIYIFATANEASHPAWGYVAAAAEAAMVGALADWFAVVALFRHPMGLPIPHTAVIANNQHRIGEGLAVFLDQNFLSRQEIGRRLANWDGALWMAQWLQQPRNAQSLVDPAVAAMRFGLQAVDNASVQEFLARNAQTALRQIDFSASAGAVLDTLTVDNRHQKLLDEALAAMSGMLDNEVAQQHMTEAIAKELKALRYLALDKAAARLTTRKIVNAVTRNLTDMGQDPDHPLRQRFDAAVRRLVERLKNDPDLRERLRQMSYQLTSQPQLQQYLQEIWGDFQQWLDGDLANPESAIRQSLERACSHLGQNMEENPEMRQWLNIQIRSIAPEVVDRYRPAIKRYVVERVGSWDTRELVREVEEHLGQDLQYIRINGTIVGGLVGLVIYSLTQWIMH